MDSMPEYKDSVTLIPYGLPQFLDFALPLEQTRKLKKFFSDEVSASINEKGEQIKRILLCELIDDPEYGKVKPGETAEFGGDFYEVRAEKHLGAFLDEWIPIPFLRQTQEQHPDGLPRFQTGPSNWARAYVSRVQDPSNSEREIWRAVLAFDMQVEEPRSAEFHVALSPDDVQARASFSLADKERDNHWFLRQGWVDGWIHSLWDDYFKKKEHRSERVKIDGMDETPALDYLAAYMVYLALVQAIIGGRRVKVANLAATQQSRAEVQGGEIIDVDLVLDIGNSRSLGILIENSVSRNTDINDSYKLLLRDMSRPYLRYCEPFETRIEFSKSDFGSAAYSKRSGRRSNAFIWPSPVRTGPEASRLASLATNAEGYSGMSSPKRYLWDQEEAPGGIWYFNKPKGAEREEIVSSCTMSHYINNAGIPISNLKELNDQTGSSYLTKLLKSTIKECRDQPALPALQPRFSRSSMMMLLFVELILQALVTINSPEQRIKREREDRPRRLRSVVFTVPPGMPFAEQRIYRCWANAAVSVLWEALGWKKAFFQEPQTGKLGRRNSGELSVPDFRCNPEVLCRWDEATCTQLVYLYNEISWNFRGDAFLFFDTMGKRRKMPREEKANDVDAELNETKPTLRVATIDIGGGTTDLSITTYVLANDKGSSTRIWPRSEMRDGFNVGGDDVLKNIVKDVFFQSIIEHLIRNCGISESKASETVRELFGQKSEDTRTQNLRIQFIRQVALPAAYALLGLYERRSLHESGTSVDLSLGGLFNGQYAKMGCSPEQPQEAVCKYFHDGVYNGCGYALNIMEINLSIPLEEIDKAINTICSTPLTGMSEVVNLYDCDVLLLSGRPSRWNSIVRKVFSLLSVAPNRIIPLHSYEVGKWYRFSNTNGKITDPKTTVSTGAILCVLAENNLEYFTFTSSNLELKNTANYIGELDEQGALQREKVWFTLYPKTANKPGDCLTRDVKFSSPITIGFRQLETPRWTATKCWRMEFSSEAARQQSYGRTPYIVKVKYEIPDEEDSQEFVPPASKDIKANLDQPEIEEVTDAQGESVSNPIRIILRTLSKKDEVGCWMDTGVIY